MIDRRIYAAGLGWMFFSDWMLIDDADARGPSTWNVLCTTLKGIQ